MGVFNLIRSDYRKYRLYGGSALGIVLLTQGFWAIFQYRFAHRIHQISFKPLRILLAVPMLLWQKVIEISTGISIPASAKIGHSFYIGHFGGIILNAEARLGNNCNISQGVTIGVSGIGDNRGVPVIGDNVFIGVNSVVAGKITIGNDVLIGSCSMVKDSLPDLAVAMGVPAVIVSMNGSKAYLK